MSTGYVDPIHVALIGRLLDEANPENCTLTTADREAKARLLLRSVERGVVAEADLRQLLLEHQAFANA